MEQSLGGIMKTIVVIILALAALLGCTKDESVKVEDAPKAVVAREVKAVQVASKEMLAYLKYSGKVEAEEVVNISPAFSAKVNEILVKEGDKISAGDILAKFDDSQLAQMEIQFTNLENNYNRMSKLYETGSIDLSSYEDIAASYKAMEKSLEYMHENVIITSPIDGVVSQISTLEGETFNNMMNPYFIRIINLEKIQVKIDVSQADSKLIASNMKVQIFDEDNSLITSGKIAYISPEADMMSGTFELGVTVNDPGTLKHNQFVRAKIILASEQAALVIPRIAYWDEQVFVVQDGKAFSRKVEIGLSNEAEYQIISGVKANDKVITVGVIGLKDNDPVKIVN